MRRTKVIDLIRQSLVAVTEPRFYLTERGFQGAFQTELRMHLNQNPIWQGDPIIEEEYQKRINPHGLRLRPDIIIHVPFERQNYQTRTQGNFVAFALKKNAYRSKALQDYHKLSDMIRILHYQLGVFININSSRTYYDHFEGRFKAKLLGFAVRLEGGNIIVSE